jgi:acyl carrier protein
MPATETVYERLTELFRDILDDDDLVLRPETTAKDVDGWDSITNVQLMLGVEREFGVHLSAGQMAALENVGDLVSVIIRTGTGS